MERKKKRKRREIKEERKQMVHNRGDNEQCAGDKFCSSLVVITVLGKICLEYCPFEFSDFAIHENLACVS